MSQSAHEQNLILTEHDACGLGIIAEKNGQPSRRTIIESGNLGDRFVHRGGINGDGSTGDGAGKMTEIPYLMLQGDTNIQSEAAEKGFIFEKGNLGLSNIFMPHDPALAARGKELIHSVLASNGITEDMIIWRNVPVDMDVISPLAQSTAPDFKQILFKKPDSLSETEFYNLCNKVLTEIETKIATEAANRDLQCDDFYICSLSSRTVVYKGMLRSDQVIPFYRDLQQDNYISAFTLDHERFSTNTQPKWKSAQPFRFMAHNGEINTILANTSKWLQQMKEVHGIEFFIDPAYSDSARMDLMLMTNIFVNKMSIQEAVMAMSRPAFWNDKRLTKEMTEFFEAQQRLIDQMDGPQMLIMSDGKYVIGHTDGMGLRPAALRVTKEGEDQGLLVFASENGAVSEKQYDVVKRANVEAGGLFVMNLETGEAKFGQEALAEIVAASNVTKKLTGKEVTLNVENIDYSKSNSSELFARRLAAGWTDDDLTFVVDPSITNGIEPNAAMGMNIPIASLSEFPQRISNYFAQMFAQVTNPPIDPNLEGASMSLTSLLGAHASKFPEANFIRLKSPILRPGQLEAITSLESIPSASIDITFEAAKGIAGMREALKRLAEEAVAKVRAGAQIIVLTDRNINSQYANIDPALALGAVDDALKAAGLRLNTSIVVDSAQIMVSHDMAVLIGFGADAVNPYGLHQYTVEKALNDEKNPQDYINNICNSSDKDLKKIMGKMGVCNISSYRDGRLFQSRGLDLAGEGTDIGNYFRNTVDGSGHHRLKELTESQVAHHIMYLMKEADMVTLSRDYAWVWEAGHRPGSFEYNVTRMVSRLYEVTDHKNPTTKQVESLPRTGRYKEREDGESHRRNSTAITSFKQVENNANDAEALLVAELQQFFSTNTKGDQAAINSFLNPEDKKAYKVPENLRKIAEFALANWEVCAFLLTRNKDDSYKYTPEEIALHLPNPELQEHYNTLTKMYAKSPANIIDFITLIEGLKPISLEQTQDVDSIMNLFTSAAMSQGAIQSPAHEALSRIFNNVGARGNSGEGGEDPQRNEGGPKEAAKSSIRQVASGRFGVTPEYLANALEIEIKVAQGAKPGQGGQLPGLKVTINIAKLRGAIPGGELISPPPHHDMYSIEDLAQLIEDLKRFGVPTVAVKLVASAGIGTIAAGVVKAGADVITVGGHAGGTGAAPVSSIYNAGMPVHEGVLEVHKSTTAAGLRHKFQLRQSGGIEVPMDVVVAAASGADQFEIGTEALVKANGCVKISMCNIACGAGIATDGDKYKRPDRIGERNLFEWGHEVRSILAKIGEPNLGSLRGRISEFFHAKINHEEMAANGIRGTENIRFDNILEPAKEPNPILLQPAPDAVVYKAPEYLDNKIIAKIEAAGGAKAIRTDAQLVICEEPATPDQKMKPIDLGNCDRSIGAGISRWLTTKFYDPDNAQSELNGEKLGKKPLPKHGLKIVTEGNAGNSFGVWDFGVDWTHIGAGNDYVGKGMGRGVLSLIPSHERHPDYIPHENAILKEKAGFGATGGELYVRGCVGERFLVRNSGASAVVEGDLGNYAFEYMTRGSAVVIPNDASQLRNLCCGMSGGVVAIYDPEGKVELGGNVKGYRINDFESHSQYRPDLKGEFDPLYSPMRSGIASMLANYVHHTTNPVNGEQSERVKGILENLDKGELQNFVFVVPNTLGKNMTLDAMKTINSSFEGQSLDSKSPLMRAVMEDAGYRQQQAMRG